MIVERSASELAKHFDEYLEIDRPPRLVFTFATHRHEAPTRVTVTCEADGDGTRLTLVHQMDANWADHVDRTRNGWTMIIEALARQIEAGWAQSHAWVRTTTGGRAGSGLQR